MAIEPSKPMAPYLPFLTFLSSFDALSQGVPPRLDRTLWRNQSGLVQGQIMNAYRFFGLVDTENGDAATEELNNMAKHPEKRAETLQGLLETCYSPVIEGQDLTKMTMKMLDEAFEKSYSVSGATKQKAITFFLKAAKFSELPLSPYLQSQLRNVGARKKRATKNGGQVSNGSGDFVVSSVSGPDVGTSKTVALQSGGTLTLTLSVNVFELQGTDREFVFGMIDKLQQYEGKKTATSE